ncbi:MAG: tetratricopeptide repeat protein [Rhodospirillales bacterium]|nr:tetratricopeptide repeat protein [Rhodospirillales bacterium]
MSKRLELVQRLFAIIQKMLQPTFCVGNALARNGDVGQAIADYDKAIRLNPNYGPAYDSRAMAYTSKGDHARALADAIKSAQLGQETHGTVTVKAKPKTSAWASKKQAETKQETSAFNPFQDRSGN